MVAGWDVSLVSSIVAETLHESIDPTVYAEAVALIEEHHAAGRDVVVVSASGAEVVEPIAAILGADHVIATRMNVVDGRYTGEIDFYAYGENKASAIRDARARSRATTSTASYAYSDSITDAPMLGTVGHAFAVNPDRALRRLAVERGWGTLSFVRPVPLFPRRARIATAGVVTVVVVAVAVVVGRRAPAPSEPLSPSRITDTRPSIRRAGRTWPAASSPWVPLVRDLRYDRGHNCMTEKAPTRRRAHLWAGRPGWTRRDRHRCTLDHLPGRLLATAPPGAPSFVVGPTTGRSRADRAMSDARTATRTSGRSTEAGRGDADARSARPGYGDPSEPASTAVRDDARLGRTGHRAP